MKFATYSPRSMLHQSSPASPIASTASRHKPTGRLFAYREYRAGQSRREFAAGGTVNGVRVAGIPIHGPAKPEVPSIEAGINRVFAAFALASDGSFGLRRMNSAMNIG